MKIYNWSDLTIDKVTNLFLYGMEATPADYLDRLRSAEQYNSIPLNSQGTRALPIQVDAASFIASGPGRYAHASESPIVQHFFDGSLQSELGLADGSYTKAQLYSLYQAQFEAQGLSANNLSAALNAKFNFTVDQAITDTSNADYALRTYVWHLESFTVSNDTVFVFSNGNADHLESLKVLPFDDNFDFKTDGSLSNIADSLVLGDRIDPYNIGVRLDFNFVNKEGVATYEATHGGAHYNYSSYTVDHGEYLAATGSDASYLLSVLPTLSGVADQLASDGTAQYYTSDFKEVIYGSISDDTLSGDHTYIQDIIVAGDGNDIIAAGAGNDFLYGGSNNDHLNGGAGNDLLYGGEGNDVLDGGTGYYDQLYGGNGTDTYVWRSDIVGNAVINDNDGVLQFDGQVLRGLATQVGTDQWVLNGYNLYAYDTDSSDARLLITSQTTPGSTVTLQGFVYEGFGITLLDGTPDNTSIRAVGGTTLSFTSQRDGIEHLVDVGPTPTLTTGGGYDTISLTNFLGDATIESGDGNDTMHVPPELLAMHAMTECSNFC